ncbi:MULTISPECIES: hypothetical protein [unclassified Streptomyces]|uniref:hypothetical protein n=1 Tax=unclassified Streptomyces TaxID=2593676 RepID=UPI00125E46E1|nr:MULTISPECIES: hypothetical protein [unclassified Streptomyces]
MAVRITPVELVRLAADVERALGTMRAEIVQAVIAERKRRAVMQAAQPDVALLARVLTALRRDESLSVEHLRLPAGDR